MTGPRRARLIGPAMLGVASGSVLVPLNTTMLAVALPSIMDQFGVDAITVSSLVTLYLGTVTIALLASGSLGDRYGQRPVFLVGVVAFALSSLLAAVSPSFAVLALSRVFHALSGALISTISNDAAAPPVFLTVSVCSSVPAGSTRALSAEGVTDTFPDCSVKSRRTVLFGMTRTEC